MSSRYQVNSLDIGTTKVCCIIAETGADEPTEILGVGMSPCSGLRKGVVVDIGETTDAIQNAVRQAVDMADLDVHSVVVGITGGHIASLNSRGVTAITHPRREISDEDIRRVLDVAETIVIPPEREILHTIPREYSVDGQAVAEIPVGMYGNRLEVEVHVVTGVSTFLQNVLKCVGEAGLSVEEVVFEPIATAECVLLAAEKQLGVALVDIGGGTCDVAIYLGGEIYYSGAVPIGGSHVTSDIAIGLRTTIEEAERVKIAHGCAKVLDTVKSEVFEFTSLGTEELRLLPTKVLAEIIEARALEICESVGEHIDKAGCRERLSAGLVLTGGGSQLRGLPDLMSDTLGMPVRLAVPTGLSGHTDLVKNAACSTAVGLIEFWRKHQQCHPGNGHDGRLLEWVERSVRALLSRIGVS